MAFVCFTISFFGEAPSRLCKKSGGEVEFIAKMGCFGAPWPLPDFERDTSAPGSLQSLPSFYLHPRIGGCALPTTPAGRNLGATGSNMAVSDRECLCLPVRLRVQARVR